MKFLHSRFICRSISVFFLLTFIQSFFIPYYSFALTGGPHQPEYTSYENAGASDMVNLLTGDFTFNLPILEVPGPEGSFALPLSYHAGIGLDQESSWVGLGFNMNVGSIVRNINQFPDDASGESQSITVQNLTGARGWSSSLLGLGQIGWNTEVGHYGTISLLGIVNYSYDKDGTSSVGLIGVNVGDNGMSFDALQFTQAVITIASYGAAAAASEGVSVGVAIAKQAAIDMAISAAVSAFTPTSAGTPTAPTAGYWKYSKRTQQKLFHKNYWIWLDQTRREKMYGGLYLGKVTNMEQVPSDFSSAIGLKIKGVTETLYKYPRTGGTVNEGAASDVNYYINEGVSYRDVNNPSTLAFDDYSVKASGISGSISPYRLEVGAVSMPREMTQYHTRVAPVRYMDYKVPFIYEGFAANSHFHHSGGASSLPTQPTFYSGLGMSVLESGSDHKIIYELNDEIFKNQRIRSDLSSSKKIAQGNNIEWLTNSEIKSTVTYPSKFLDFLSGQSASGLSGSDRFSFRSNFALGSSAITSTAYTSTTSFSETIPMTSTADFKAGDNITLSLTSFESGSGQEIYASVPVVINTVSSSNIVVYPDPQLNPFLGKATDIVISYKKTPQIANSIGGFCITGEDGRTFHFALPVYDYDMYSEMKDVTDPTNKRSVISRASPFANTWLLTAITGADYLDVNGNGLADAADWGYWVKFNYGKYTDDYQWRLPYAGDIRSSGNDIDSYSKGFKQLYYLNSIETRSHVALFFKSARSDGRSVNTRGTLKLDEIGLFTREQYNKLVAPSSAGGFALPEFSNQIANICHSSSISSSARSYINLNCTKRVLFTYSYNLCKNTLNSISPEKGKLTLTGISVRGRGDKKIVPDYKFEYSNNPNYGASYWDGWGMYSIPNYDSPHTTIDAAGNDGTAWSLSKIVTPLGSEIIINHERDTYSSISGEAVLGPDTYYSRYNYDVTYPGGAYNQVMMNSTAGYAVNDRVRLTGEVKYKCYGSTTYTTKSYSGEYTITAINSTGVTLNADYLGLAVCGSSGNAINLDHNNGTMWKVYPNRNGGDIRVASLIMRDEFGKENKIRYLYKNDDGSSSGVVAQEPDYIKVRDLPFYKIPGYPSTPVMYGKVSVLTGNLTTDTDFHTKQVYEFETPHSSMITAAKVTIKPRTLDFVGPEGITPVSEHSEIYQHNLSNRTSRIGSLKGIKVYDKAGQLVSQNQMEYTEQPLNSGVNNYQGVYSEGVLMFDVISEPSNFDRYHKLNRTTTFNYPYVLKKVTNTKDGFSSSSENISWDYYTGMVNQKLDKSALGVYIKTVSKPAYTAYPELGLKGNNINNKNMVLQNAATYVYRSDAAGNTLGLVSADVQTWRKDWSNYRYYTGTAYADEGTQANPVWRKGPAYTWKGTYARMQADGSQSFSVADEFNFSGTNPLWQYRGEGKRFDHYGMPLESVDLNGIYAASKMGYDDRAVIASAANAKYNEIAFSSAEDKIATQSYFGGEVGLGAGTLVTTPVHTGNTALSVSTGYGFVFKSQEITTGKAYRASVWANSTNGRIYYKLNNGSEVVPAQTVSQAVAVPGMGNWYRIDLAIANPTSTIIEVGVKSLSGTVVFDDFRFQPADAVMNCYVYPPLGFEFTSSSATYSEFAYTLDNDNLFTKYETNEKGELVKTYSESLKYGVKIISETKTNLRGLNN